eukprot:m.169580 g.169580  ORF g.169580 m.169580 type:complete len:67 (+) comp39003_c0_seq1:262-462(+)
MDPIWQHFPSLNGGGVRCSVTSERLEAAKWNYVAVTSCWISNVNAWTPVSTFNGTVVFSFGNSPIF